MIICLNTTHSDRTLIKAIHTDGTVFDYEDHGEDVVRAVDDFMAQHAPEHVEGWCPVVGAGRFSATRRAVCVANALAFAGGVNAVAISSDMWNNSTAVREVFEKTTERFAQALYSGAPSITKPHASQRGSL